MIKYLVTYSTQTLDKPSAFLDGHFSSLCKARKGNYARKPIYKTISFLKDSDISRRYIPDDELCQCCETKLAKMIKGELLTR